MKSVNVLCLLPRIQIINFGGGSLKFTCFINSKISKAGFLTITAHSWNVFTCKQTTQDYCRGYDYRQACPQWSAETTFVYNSIILISVEFFHQQIQNFKSTIVNNDMASEHLPKCLPIWLLPLSCNLEAFRLKIHL